MDLKLENRRFLSPTPYCVLFNFYGKHTRFCKHHVQDKSKLKSIFFKPDKINSFIIWIYSDQLSLFSAEVKKREV